MRQSGERFASRDALREMRRAFPGPPKIDLPTSDYGGQRFNTVLIIELRDELIVRETRYYAEPFEAPAWRASWVEAIDVDT
jgi:hypothetical protein